MWSKVVRLGREPATLGSAPPAIRDECLARGGRENGYIRHRLGRLLHVILEPDEPPLLSRRAGRAGPRAGNAFDIPAERAAVERLTGGSRRLKRISACTRK